MKRLHSYWTAVLALTSITCSPLHNAQAGCCDHVSAEAEDNQSAIIIEARVTQREVIRLNNGNIVTDVTIEPIEFFKGETQTPLVIRFSGGRIDDETQWDSATVSLVTGENYILRLIRHGGSWKCLNAKAEKATPAMEQRRNKYRAKKISRGGKIRRFNLAPLLSTEQAEGEISVSPMAKPPKDPEPEPEPTPVPTLGYFEDSNGIPTRFSYCDSGEAISYLVDSDSLPPGISQSQALLAVEEALAAWSSASGLKFKFEGQGSFGAAANSITDSDYKLRIQLHDQYNVIPSTSTLGKGGGAWTGSSSYPSGGSGGNVAGQEFHKRVRGYCILNDGSSSMSTYSTFVEVLTHEIGHALGLSHSSEDPAETDTDRKNAIMYYSAHKGGRGALLGDYDSTTIHFAYPGENMPPAGMDRIMLAVTGSPQPNGLGVDRLTVSGSDRETPESVSVQVINGSATSNNGIFSTFGENTIIYSPSGSFSDSTLSESQIDAGSFYDKINYRVSDGTNLSAFQEMKIIGFRRDTTPSDGLPDSWMITHFGSTAVGEEGAPNHPDSDPDGDGMSNRIEYVYGSDPNDSASYPPLMVYDHNNQSVSWNTIKNMPYYLEQSDDMSSWTLIHSYLGDGNRRVVDLESDSNAQRFYRVRLQP